MSTSLEAGTLFRVDGIVAAITGGGTGEYCITERGKCQVG